MKSLLIVFVLVCGCFISNAQGPFPYIAANNVEQYQDLFYYDSFVVIQRQQINETELKEKLQGKWRNVENKKWEFLFLNDDKKLKYIGIGSGTGDTVSGGYSIFEITDTIRNQDKYKGTGFYIIEVEERVIESNCKYPINDLMNRPGIRFRAYRSPTEYIIDNQKIEYDVDGYKILEIHDNTLILSMLDDIYVFTRVQ